MLGNLGDKDVLEKGKYTESPSIKILVSGCELNGGAYPPVWGNGVTSILSGCFTALEMAGANGSTAAE